jgi:hypothetical protein
MLGKGLNEMFEIKNKEIEIESERAIRDSKKDPSFPISIEDIIAHIRKGEWVIPEFQRDFVWSMDKFKLLCDSIFKGYTIGNLLLWKSKENLAYRKIGEKEVLKNTGGKELCYILDGQQRLTTLYGVLGGHSLVKINKKGDIISKPYKIYFDTETSSFFSEKDTIKINGAEIKIKNLVSTNHLRFIELSKIFSQELKFPDCIIEPEREKIMKELEETENTKEFRRKTDILEGNKKKLENLAEIFKRYRIHRIEETESLAKVVTIFERINTQNVRLDISDIMVAKTFRTIDYSGEKKNFNLRYALQKILYNGKSLDKTLYNPELSLNYGKESFYKIDNVTALRLISIIQNKDNPKISGLQKEHIYDLKAESIQENLELFRTVLANIRNYLSNELNINDLDTQYTDNKILSFLTSIIAPISRYSELKTEVLNKWFWNTLIYNRYPGAQLQGIEADIESFKEGLNAFNEQIRDKRAFSKLTNKKYSFKGSYLINAGYDAQNSLYQSLILLLNSRKPIDFNSNSKIDLMLYFGDSTKNNKHHIIPFNSKAADFLRKKYGKSKAEVLLNNIGNIAIISRELNQDIGGRNPEIYLPEYKKQHKNFDKFLNTHLIEEEMYSVLVNEKDYEKFILMRNQKLLSEIEEKTKINSEDLNLAQYFSESSNESEDGEENEENSEDQENEN